MTRTNIDIDDEACAAVMQRYGLSTKREAVNLALRSIAVRTMTLEEALAMQGTGWEGDLDEIRRNSPQLEAWLDSQHGEPSPKSEGALSPKLRDDEASSQ